MKVEQWASGRLRCGKVFEIGQKVIVTDWPGEIGTIIELSDDGMVVEFEKEL